MMLLIILSAVFVLSALYYLISLITAKRNYMKNKRISCNVIVNDQNGKTGEQFSFGLFKASYNGCAPIALHNALILKGRKSDLCDVMYLTEKSMGLILFGLFGVYAFGLKIPLRRLRLPFRMVKLNNLERDGIYIIKYKHDGNIMHGEHFVALKVESGVYISYNLYGDGKEYRIDPKDYAEKGYVTGYKIL